MLTPQAQAARIIADYPEDEQYPALVGWCSAYLREHPTMDAEILRYRTDYVRYLIDAFTAARFARRTKAGRQYGEGV